MIIPLYLGLLTSDPSVGRVNKSSLSQETLMELFIKDFENRKIITFDDANANDVSDWRGVTVNESTEVTSLYWCSIGLSGSTHLEWMPPTIYEAVISWNVLLGTLSLEELPESLQNLYLQNNAFSGTVFLTHLPKALEELHLGHNKLHGSLDFTCLPPNIQYLKLGWNDFSGQADFSRLPKSLTDFNVQGTRLEGTILVESERKGYFHVEGSKVS